MRDIDHGEVYFCNNSELTEFGTVEKTVFGTYVLRCYSIGDPLIETLVRHFDYRYLAVEALEAHFNRLSWKTKKKHPQEHYEKIKKWLKNVSAFVA